MKKLLLIFVFGFSLIAAPVMAQEAEDQDPIEGFNRLIFGFNRVVDTVLIRPIAWGYKHGLPNYVQDRVSDFFSNIGEPVNFLNSGLQGDFDQASTTLGRFLVNSTLGLGGLYDQAQGFGLPYRNEDFGQTLGNWGAGHGFYLVLPILGPSSARDGVGRLVDSASNPFNYIKPEGIPIGLAIGNALQTRAKFLQITDDFDAGIDPYATYRSAYLQRRLDLVYNGSEPVVEAPQPVVKKKKRKKS